MRRTTTKSKRRPLRNRNAQGPDELSQAGTPNQIRQAINGDAGMRSVFASYPHVLDTLAANPIFGRTLIRLVSEGCASGELLSFLNSLVNRDGILSRFKKDLNFLKSRLSGLIRRLDSLREDVVTLNEIRIGLTPFETALASTTSTIEWEANLLASICLYTWPASSHGRKPF